MTSAHERSEPGTSGDARAGAAVVRTRRRVLASSAALLGTLGVAGTTGLTAASAAASQSDGPTIRVSVADDEVDAGDTTRLELVLSEVPEEGLTGWTILAELTGSGRAVFTGEGEFTELMSLAELDMEHTDSDSAGFFNGANAGGVQAGDEDVLIGDVEVQAVEEGTVEVDFDVQELSDGTDDRERIDAEIGSASFTVNGTDDSFDGIEPGDDDGDEDDSDSDGDGSADGDGTTDVDPAPGDSDDGDSDTGDSDDGTGDDGDGASDDGDVDGDGSNADGESDDGDVDGDGGNADGESDDGDGADSVPGFGIGAAVTAVLAGTAARIARGAGDDETEVAE